MSESEITRTITAYRDGAIGWPELREYLVHLHYRQDLGPEDPMHDDPYGTQAEVALNYDWGNLTESEYLKVLDGWLELYSEDA